MIDLDASAREKLVAILQRCPNATALRQAIDDGSLSVPGFEVLIAHLKPQYKEVVNLSLGMGGNSRHELTVVADICGYEPYEVTKMVRRAQEMMLSWLGVDTIEHTTHLTPPHQALSLPPLLNGFRQAIWRGIAEREKFDHNFRQAVWEQYCLDEYDLVRAACAFARQVLKPHRQKLEAAFPEHLKPAGKWITATANRLLLNAAPTKPAWTKGWSLIVRRIAAVVALHHPLSVNKRLEALSHLCLGIIAQSHCRLLWTERILSFESKRRIDAAGSVQLHAQLNASVEHGENFIRLLLEVVLEDSCGTAKLSSNRTVRLAAARHCNRLAGQMLQSLSKYRKEAT